MSCYGISVVEGFAHKASHSETPPKFKEQFILQTDASDRGCLGEVLIQIGQGQKLSIAYTSRKLKECE